MISPPGHPGVTASHALLRGSICVAHCLGQPGITNCIYIQYGENTAPLRPQVHRYPRAGFLLSLKSPWHEGCSHSPLAITTMVDTVNQDIHMPDSWGYR